MGNVLFVYVDCASNRYMTILNRLIDSMTVVGILNAALLETELGVVCLPAPNVAVAAIGMLLDLLLDIYIVFRAFRLFSKSDGESQPIEFVVLISSIALATWHFVTTLEFLALILEYYSVVI